MKILHVNHLLDPVSGGGTAERTFQLARALTAIGEECGILTLDIGNSTPYESLFTGERVFKLPCINQRYFIHITWPFRIRRVVQQFDVAHLMGHWTLLNAIVALICLLRNKPYIVCPAGSLKPAGRSRRLKIIYDFVIGRWVIKKASAWIAITEDEKKDFLAYGITPDLVQVIPNGIDPEQYQLTESIAGLPAGLEEKIGKSPYILFLGRLNPIKGPDLLINAFIQLASQFPEFHLVIAGSDAGMLKELQMLAGGSNVADRIHFSGYVGGDDKVNLLKNAYCLVIPSRREAMSVVVLEAGACGTPVLFTDRCGLKDFALEKAGVMVEAGEAAIRTGLASMLSDPKGQQQYAAKLGELVNANYLWSSQASRYQKLYLKLLRR